MNRDEAVRCGMECYEGELCAKVPGHGTERYADNGACVECTDAAEKKEAQAERESPAPAIFDPLVAVSPNQALVFMPQSPDAETRAALTLIAGGSSSGLGAIVLVEARRRVRHGTHKPVRAGVNVLGKPIIRDEGNGEHDAMFREFADRLQQYPPAEMRQALRFLPGLFVCCPRHTASLISAMSVAVGEALLTDAECVELGKVLPLWVEHWVEGLRSTL